ncbi:CPBP family intramembrane metalloprotease [Secundilactobacillus malefermentans]|nr:CPBP family intramembrane metalloprotease [Secundilactobacillus malefermentans]
MSKGETALNKSLPEQQLTPKTNRYLWFISLFVLIQLVQIPIILFRYIGIKDTPLKIANSVLYVGAFAAVIWLAIFLLHRLPGQHYFAKLNSHQWAVTGLGLVAFFAVEIVLGLLNAKLTGQNQTANNDTLRQLMGADSWSLYLMAFSGIFLSPILEETVFRGYLMNAFFKPNAFWLPVIISGLLFSVAHGSTTIISFLIYAGMGWVLAFTYRKVGSLWASISIHMLNNLIAMTALLISIK